MKKVRFLLLTLLTLLLGGVNSAWAQSYVHKSPYVVDFNETIVVPTSNTAAPLFQVSTGWTRIAPSAAGDGYGPYYMRYTYSSKDGVSGTGTLLANAQQAPQSTYDGTIETVYDYIVTPKVSGTVSIQVKGSASASSSLPSFIRFYKIDDDATTVGEEITAAFTADINTSNFVTASFNLGEEASRIAIRAQWVYMDDFTAGTAEVPQIRALTIMSLTAEEGVNNGNYYVDANSDGTFNIKYTITVKNTGNVDLTQGEENYSISGFKRYYESTTLSEGYAVPFDLKAGVTSEPFTVELVMPATAMNSNGWAYYDIKDNLSGNTKQGYWTYVTAYEPLFYFQIPEYNYNQSSPSSLSAIQAYGLISTETTKNFEIHNSGAAPLVIKSITIPEGFTSEQATTTEFTIAKKESYNVAITLPTTKFGSFSDNLEIVYVNAAGTEVTYTLPFSGTVIDASKWTAAFDDGNSNLTWPEGSLRQSQIKDGNTLINGKYDYFVTTDSYVAAKSNNWFVTPKLHATAGENMSFDVKRRTSSGDYYLKVYVSTDRETWGDAVKTITNSDLTSDYQTFDFSIAEEGDYYIGFEIYYVALDNIYGFTKVDGIEHDIYYVSATLPTETKSGSKVTAKLDIIPVLAESAENYLVKYYVDNIAVATAESVDLTAGASKTFSIDYTPEVDATKEFTTYVAMELTDGTVLAKSGEETLKVTNEPEFVFVQASTTVVQNTSNYTTAQAFGKVNTTTEVKSFKIHNRGTATLKIKSIVAPEGFSVNVTDPFELASGEEQPINVTFAAENAGDYAGNLVVTYEKDVIGTEESFELAFSGTMLDPTKWYANFDNASSSSIVWPAGLVYESSIQTSYSGWGPYNCFVYTYGSTESNNKIITPLLRAAAGDKFSFDVKNYGYSSHKVNVYLSSDRENWGEAIYTNESIDNSDFATIEATIPEAGEYYVGIAMTGVYVDELYGLTPVAVAHEWSLVSSNIPTEGMQNVPLTATVNVANFGIVDEAAENITVTAYLDNEAVATGEAVAIPMSHQLSAAGTQLSVKFHSPKVGTFPVYVEVKAGDYSVATAPVDVVFAEEIAVADATEVGTRTSADRYHGPIDWYNADGSGTRWTDIVYTAEELAEYGITAGSKITKIAFHGSGTAKSIKAKVTSWVGTKTGDITPGTINKAEMTEISVYDQTDAAATIDFSNTELDLSQNPIVYDGTSDIRIYTETVGQGSGNWNTVTYAYDSDYMTSYYNSSTAVATPLGYFTLAAEPATIAGTVMGADGAATVTLVSTDGDNIQYSGNVVDGNYTVNVIQTTRKYNVTVKNGTNEVVAKNVSFADGSVTKNFNFGTLVLNGNATEAPAAAVYAKVDLGRKLNKGWNAVALPFALSKEDLGTEEIAAYVGDEEGVDGNITVKFERVAAIKANVPYLIHLDAAQAENPVFENVDVTVAEAKAEGTTFDFVGVYEQTLASAGDYFISGGKFVRATTNNNILAFRSYLQLKDTETARGIRFFVDGEEIDATATGIAILKQDVAADSIYSLSGQKVEQAQKGLYIVNGKKVVVK